jgi:hypothetical protein
MCKKFNHTLSLVFFLFSFTLLQAQELYTARGYWQESTRETYRKLKHKQTVGDSLSVNEVTYLQDYEAYLATYYQRMPEDEKVKYQQMKAAWDRELLMPAKKETESEDFDWRREWGPSSLYGLWYGTSLVVVSDISGAAAAGIPLVTGGLWALGPVINPKKFEGINRPVLRAANTGRFLGLLYGGSLGLTIGGESESFDELFFGLSTVGSIALGEVGFHLQKRKNYSEGHIEMIRHYGTIGPWLGVSLFAATESDNANLAGFSLLAGGAAGLLIGHGTSKKYDYTRGDVESISSLTLITTGLGFALMAESLENSNDGSGALLLIPAAATVLGSLWGQKAVKGIYLTKRQGNTISYATTGAALLGFGIAAMAESESTAVWIGLPSAFALITHQILFHKYKKENLVNGLEGRNNKTNHARFSINVKPENFFINQRLATREHTPQPGRPISNPLINLKLTF